MLHLRRTAPPDRSLDPGRYDLLHRPQRHLLGRPRPYWHSYTYDKAGNRQTEVIHDVTGNTAKDTERTYTYPGAPNAQPHTLTSVTTAGPTGESKDTYTYDEAGNTETRTLGGDTQRLTWDAEGHLAKVTEPVEGSSDKVTEYLYDTEGNRLIARTPTETTLYLGATEITLATGSTTPKATRYFDLGGGHQAVQQDDGSVSITLADHHGTAQLAIDTATQQLTQRRTLPFGGLRGTEPADWPGTKGFVGGTDDTKTTGLTHLGAREYDPSTGRFISVDPLLEIDKPQTLNGYTYGAQNPLTFTDPTGLGLACGGNGDGTGCPTRDDGTAGNGRPNEAADPADLCVAPCGSTENGGDSAADDYQCGYPGCSTMASTGYGPAVDEYVENNAPRYDSFSARFYGFLRSIAPDGPLVDLFQGQSEDAWDELAHGCEKDEPEVCGQIKGGTFDAGAGLGAAALWGGLQLKHRLRYSLRMSRLCTLSVLQARPVLPLLDYLRWKVRPQEFC